MQFDLIIKSGLVILENGEQEVEIGIKMVKSPQLVKI